jgi:hypothetical protein
MLYFHASKKRVTARRKLKTGEIREKEKLQNKGTRSEGRSGIFIDNDVRGRMRNRGL